MKNLKHILIAVLVIVCGACIFTGCNKGTEDKVYKIMVNQNLHGKVSVNKETAKEGENVTISIEADEGYELYAMLCDGVVITSNTIVMPAKNITVSAIFEQLNENFKVRKGSYVEIADASVNGSYVHNNSFCNTITVKDNNLFDIFMDAGDQFIELKNIQYSQNGNVINATAIENFGYTVEIVNNETIITRSPDNSSMQIFCYQEDVILSTGRYSYSHYKNSKQYTTILDVKENNNIEFEVFDEDEITIYKYEAEYDIKGNTLFIDVESFYLFVKLKDASNNKFISVKILSGDKADTTYTEFEEYNYAHFNKVTE